MNENQLAENLMYYRKKKGLSQEKIAEYMDVSRQAVTKWEANSSKPSSNNLIKLAQLFEVDIDTLLGNENEDKSSTQIAMNNYKMVDKIYRREDDKKRAKCSMPINVIYILLLCVGIGIAGLIFEVRGIENNTLPAMKICGLLLLGIMSATIGFYFENNKIKKWNPANTNYKISIVSIISLFMCLIMYVLMCIVLDM